MNSTNRNLLPKTEPDWHQVELARRISRFEAGQEPMMPLAQAKLLLRQEIMELKDKRLLTT
jgi:hypothetical protein